MHLIWIPIWIKVTWVSICKQQSFGRASRKTNGHSCNWFERFRNQSITTWWCWQTIKKGMFICLELTGKPGIYKLFWNESGRDWTAMFTRNSLNFVNNLCLIVLVLFEVQRSKVLSWWRSVMHLFFSINQSEHAFESELELCDFSLQQRMARPAVNRSACSTGEKFCLPCGVWRCFFTFQHAVGTPLDLNLLHRRVQGYSPNDLSEDICTSITPGL